MKQKGILKQISLFLVCVLVAVGINVLPAKAGSSSIVVDDSSFAKELNVSLWNNPNNDIQIQDGTLVFPKKSTAATSLITRVNARLSEYHKELVSAEVTIQLQQLPKGENFVLAFGLASVEALMGEPGNVEIHFTNSGRPEVSVKAYSLEGEAVTIAKPTDCGSLGSRIKVDVSISADSVFALVINGKKICEKELPCSGEGRVGFLQTGSCEVTVSDMRIVCHEYDRPQNVNVKEDFEQEAINTNTLTAKMVYASPNYAPSRMLIEEMDGNRVLRFHNSGPSYVGTMYQYSNFEMSFDVVYLQREAELDEEGNITVPRCDNFAVSFGDEAADYTGYGYETSTDMLVFEGGSTVRSMNTEKIGYAIDKGYPFYSSECEKDFTVKVSVIDSVISVGIKWLDEEQFTEILQYQMSGETPTGYVHIWTTALTANFAIDNFSIINKDKDANLVEAEYKSALVAAPADYDYQPMEYVYSDNVTEEEKDFNFYLLIPVVAFLCVVAIGIAWIVKKKKNLCRTVKVSALLLVMAVTLSGCLRDTKETVTIETMEAEEAEALSFPFIGGDDVMPIAGYYGPYVASYSEDAQSPPNYITEEYWEMIADCGINLMSYSTADYASVPEEVIKNLEYGEKYGVAVTVTDSEVISMATEEKISMDELTTRLSEYMNFPAFAGLYMIDEPCTSYFHPAGEGLEYRYLDYYKDLAPVLNREIGIYTYTNAYPSGLGNNEFDRYEQYVREFYDVLKPNYLLFDRYPFDAAQEGYVNRYFYDLAIVRNVAQEKNIPFWTFIQAGSQWNDSQERFDSVIPYYPNEGQFDWNVNTCLAFGAKGINYFPMIQPYHFAYAESEAFDFERNGLIGAWGNKTQWYYYAQDINKHIGAIDEVLMNSANKGVLACGKQATSDMGLAKDYDVLLEGTSWRELKSVDGEALIGCFNYQGKTALYVVNYLTESAQKVNLTFRDTYNVTVIQNAETRDLQGSGMTLDMLPGEGVLLVFE